MNSLETLLGKVLTVFNICQEEVTPLFTINLDVSLLVDRTNTSHLEHLQQFLSKSTTKKDHRVYS